MAVMAEWWRDTPAQRYVRTPFTVEPMSDEKLAKRAEVVALAKLRKPGEERSNKREAKSSSGRAMGRCTASGRTRARRASPSQDISGHPRRCPGTPWRSAQPRDLTSAAPWSDQCNPRRHAPLRRPRPLRVDSDDDAVAPSPGGDRDAGPDPRRTTGGDPR